MAVSALSLMLLVPRRQHSDTEVWDLLFHTPTQHTHTPEYFLPHSWEWQREEGRGH